MKIDNSLVLRAAHRSEARLIATMSRLQIEYGLNWRWTTAKVRRQIDDKETMVLVASVNGVLEGFAIMKFGDMDAHLLLFAVEPKSRRTGIGTALLRWLVSSCQTAGIEKIQVEVRNSNENAIRFYEKRGFRFHKKLVAYYDGREPAVVMTRELLKSADL